MKDRLQGGVNETFSLENAELKLISASATVG